MIPFFWIKIKHTMLGSEGICNGTARSVKKANHFRQHMDTGYLFSFDKKNQSSELLQILFLSTTKFIEHNILEFFY